MIRPKILVTGATGGTGTPVVNELLAKGFPVRAAVHRLDARSAALAQRGVEVVVVDLYDADQLLDALDADEVYLAVVAVDLPLRRWHQQDALMRAGFNFLYCPQHLRLPRSASLAKLAECDHVVSSYRGEAASVVDKLFAQHGLNRRVVASLASMVAVVSSLRQAPLVTIQPDLYAGLLDLTDLSLMPMKTSPPLTISISAVWHNRYERDPLHRYVRDGVRQVVKALPRMGGVKA